MEIKAVRGMHDLFGEELARWAFVETRVKAVLETFGYAEIRTPVLEKIEVFSQTVGDDTDIVEKQMYTVEDRAERSEGNAEKLVMRPEGTAAFIRAVVEHQLFQSGQTQRFSYYLPMFRYERPQKGRLRQFHQFGAELILDPSPEADVELIALLDHLFKGLGLTTGEYEIRINSVGCAECRPQYKARLQEYFRPRLGELCEQCKKRFERAPLRILDCKSPVCGAIAAGAPLITDSLCAACRTHHDGVKKGLAAGDVACTEDPHIVRGLDYYCRTAFEFTSNLLGAQSALGGGGRYDGLSARFGKAPFPAVGWALGMERLMMALETKQAIQLPAGKPLFFLAPIGDAAFEKFFPMSLALKRKGLRVQMSYERAKGLKWLLKQADRLGASYALIVGDTELTANQAILKDMRAGSQESVKLDTIEKEIEQRGHRD